MIMTRLEARLKAHPRATAAGRPEEGRVRRPAPARAAEGTLNSKGEAELF